MNQSITADIAGVMEMVRQSGLLTSLCTITTPPVLPDGFDASGSPDPETPYIDLPGHIDIPCKDAPIQTGDSVSVSEVKTMQDIQAVNLRHVLLDNYYPAIIPAYRATIDGVVYDIENVESDSFRTMTRLALELRTI